MFADRECACGQCRIFDAFEKLISEKKKLQSFLRMKFGGLAGGAGDVFENRQQLNSWIFKEIQFTLDE